MFLPLSIIFLSFVKCQNCPMQLTRRILCRFMVYCISEGLLRTWQTIPLTIKDTIHQGLTYQGEKCSSIDDTYHIHYKAVHNNWILNSETTQAKKKKKGYLDPLLVPQEMLFKTVLVIQYARTGGWSISSDMERIIVNDLLSPDTWKEVLEIAGYEWGWCPVIKTCH